MLDNIIFYFVFLSQIVLISFYFPRKMLRRTNHVFAKYPPSEYPKLYPKPIEYYEKLKSNYKNINLSILLVGLLLLTVLLGYPGSREWDFGNIVFPYFFIQFFPLILIEIESFKIYKLMRQASSIRKADLHPRSLFDFVSPKMIGVAIFVYFAFIVFVIFINQFEFPWFGGYGNIVGITAINFFFTGIIIWNLYGKKQDPYQAFEDRKRQIELIVKQLVFISIVATLFIVITVILNALDLRHFNTTAMSLYFQMIAVIALRTLRIDSINFEVYKKDPSQESEEIKSCMVSDARSSSSGMGVGLWIGLGLGVLLGAFILIEGGTIKGFALGAGIGIVIGMVIGILLDFRKGTSTTI